jgi:hypothetical protein
MSCELEGLRCPSSFSKERTNVWRSVRQRGRVEEEEEKDMIFSGDLTRMHQTPVQGGGV